MSHADAILAAVLAEPDEVTHRLVYADWLEEYGDAAASDRAEFIRAQLKRTALPPAAQSARALRRREAELLHRHGEAWASGLPRRVRTWAFHRGFVEEVTLTAEDFLAAGAWLFDHFPLRRLNLRGTQRLPDLLAEPSHRRLFADLLCRIQVLDLSRESLNDSVGAVLLGLPRLPRLRGLRLGYHALSDEGTRELARSPVLAGVRELEFTPATASLWAVEALLHSRWLTELEVLCLGGGRVGDRLVPLVCGMPGFRRLRSLRLGHSGLTSANLALFDREAALESLDVSFNRLGGRGVRALDGVLPRLRELNLSRAELGDDGAAAVAASSLPGRLLGLDLSLNRIGPAGGRALAGYTGPRRLQTLDLIYNALGEAEAAVADRFSADVCLFRR